MARQRHPKLRPLLPEDIRRQVVLEEHDLSTAGDFAVVVRRFVAGNAYRSHLWVVPLRKDTETSSSVVAGRPLRLTSGAVRDRAPRISPDGRSVAFRRRRLGGQSVKQLCVIRLSRDGRAAGPVRTLTRGPHPVTELAWSPDGRQIAFTRTADPPRFLVGKERGDESPLVRCIRRVDWRYDGDGPLDHWKQLFVVDARADADRAARARQLTRLESDVSGICWMPDGSSIVCAADPRPDADIRPRSSIWRVPARGGEATEIVALGGNAHSPAVSDDGRWIAAVGVADADALDDVSPGLFVARADGSAPPRELAPGLDRPVGAWIDTDLNGWVADAQSAPVWTDDGTLLALVSDAGRCVPWRYRFHPESGQPLREPERLAEADAACWGLASHAGVITVVGTDGVRAMELLAVEPASAGDGGGLRGLTTIGSRWQRDRLMPEMRSLLAAGDGGSIETWLASPPDAGEVRLPTVVDIHGGPLGAWAPAPSVEVMLLVSRGYRVVLPNIRGSATYGAAWIRPQLGDWGGVDAADVHRALDHVVDLGLADPERLGALGLSYGGFMVNWLIGTSDRFRAAVSENGVANQVAAWANSDTGPEYSRTARLGDTLTAAGVEKLWRQSALRHVATMHTPLLMLQAGADLRCPPADTEQLFVALRHLGREVEYVLYPDEYHVYQADGRPDRRVDRMTRMLDWFDRYVKG